ELLRTTSNKALSGRLLLELHSSQEGRSVPRVTCDCSSLPPTWQARPASAGRRRAVPTGTAVPGTALALRRRPGAGPRRRSPHARRLGPRRSHRLSAPVAPQVGGQELPVARLGAEQDLFPPRRRGGGGTGR